MKRKITIGLALLVLITVVLAISMSVSTSVPALAVAPTHIPDQNAIPGDAVSRSAGGLFKNAVGIEGSADEVQLVIVPFSAATASVMEIHNYQGTPVWYVNSDGDVTEAGDYSPSLVNVAVPTAVGTATPGLRITNLGVADSMAFLDGASVVGLIQDDGFINWEAGMDMQVPTAQATGVPGLNIKNSSVAASINVAEGESVFQAVEGTTGDFSGAVTANGGFSVDTPAFTVADTSGNTVIAGSLAANGGITADSTAFTVADTTGNVATTGSLTASGVAALNGGITVDTSAFTVADTSGNVATAGTLDVQGGAITLQNDETIDNSVDGTITMTVSATGAVTVKTGNLRVGDGTAGQTINGEDAYVEGLLEVDGVVYADGGITSVGAAALNGGITVDSTAFTVADTSGNVATTGTLGVTGLSTLTGGESIPVNIENLMQPTVLSVPITYTAGAGGTIVLATVGANEVWFVHDIAVHVTTGASTTAGTDGKLNIGTGEDVDGFCVLTETQLTTTYAPFTGFAEGWTCSAAADRGVFFDEVTVNGFMGSFVLESTETIDAAWSAAGDDLLTGAVTVYIVYTRIS